MSTRVRCPGCNAEWPATLQKCYKCGAVLQAGVGAPTYSPDDAEVARLLGRPVPGGAASAAGSGVYREGGKLVMTEGCDMPRRCPVCNSDDVEGATDLTISRESKETGGVSGMIKAGMDMVGGWNYTGPVEVTVYFCERHAARLRNRLIGAAAVTAVCLLYLLIVYLRYDKNQVGREYYDIAVAVIGAAGGVAMLLAWGKRQSLVWFKPYRFVDRTVWVTGAGREFLESLPQR